MEPQERLIFRVLGIAFAILYVVAVGVLALWKVALAAFKVPSDGLPWAEVFYGPAISVISICLMCLGGMGIEHLVRAHKGRR